MKNADSNNPLTDRHDASHPVILFDGVCNLCHASVRWIIRRDPKAIFKFASLQSAAGDKLHPSGASSPNPSGPSSLSTVILVDPASDLLWSKSDAWLEIMKRLGAPWSWLGVLKIFPRSLRDAAYDFVAARRYRWFGKKETCPLPDPKLKNRFLD